MNTTEPIKTISTAKDDLDLYVVVKQVCEITGSSHDVAATALFDCNYDIERAVDKIFEKETKIFAEEEIRGDGWKEVAKARRKVVVGDIAVDEHVKNESKVEEEAKGRRGPRITGRGGRGCDLSARGNVRRPYVSRRWMKPKEQEIYLCVVDKSHIDKVHNHCYEWLMDDMESTITECATEISKMTLTEDNAADVVSKLSNKEGVFGDFSRTKAPPPSSILATVPIKLVTSSGVMSLPSSAFNFGLDFSEYYINTNKIKNGKILDINDSKIISKEDNNEKVSDCDYNSRQVFARHLHKSLNNIKEETDDIGNVQVHDSRKVPDLESKKVNIPNKENYDRSVYSVTSFSSSLPTNYTTYSSDTVFPPMLSALPQLCPPPGMSNAHILQQHHNNPQQYLSLMNLPSGPSLFDMVSSANDNPQLIHSLLDNKEFLSKNTKVNEHDHSTIINTMQMPNICCFPQMYMNNFANFLPTIPLSVESQQHETILSSNSKPPMLPHSSASRNYQHNEDFSTDSIKYKDAGLTNKNKYIRTTNYVSNFVAGCNVKDDNQHDKSNQRQSLTAAINRPGQAQQNISNDPHFLSFQQHPSQPYSNNMFSCVTVPGTLPSGAHPYAMSHQAGGLQQLQLMQQQIHNFPQSYQLQEHLMTSMVPNGNNRTNSNGRSHLSRNNRSNTLWHP